MNEYWSSIASFCRLSREHTGSIISTPADKFKLHYLKCNSNASRYKVCKLSNETGNVAPDLATPWRRNLEFRLQVRRERMQAEPLVKYSNEEPKFIERVPACALYVYISPGDPGASHFSDTGIDLENSPFSVKRKHTVYPPLYLSMSQRTAVIVKHIVTQNKSVKSVNL
ncbi:hypothetical protein NQ318_008016 [Aromia moschata]|uniref:Uncharacterized protein n=1 Tax=Aromia moschata TaxID=1265417 RepID=A0AAV8XJN3_9CUCU|nr:hypothetical protein NQ318_008016 [Aromia moschata]